MVSALRFLYGVTLGRTEQLPLIPYGKKPQRLPSVLSPEEVLRLLNATPPGPYRMLFQTTYACGLRLNEVIHLRVTDLDSSRMVLHVRQGKGDKERLLPLSPRRREGLVVATVRSDDEWVLNDSSATRPATVAVTARIARRIFPPRTRTTRSGSGGAARPPRSAPPPRCLSCRAGRR